MDTRPFLRVRLALAETLRWAVSLAVAYVVAELLRPAALHGVLYADNTLLTISLLTREGMRVLENDLVATKKINREYDSRFAQEGAKIGDTVNVRKPPRYLGRDGQAIQIEDATETSVPVRLDTQSGVDISFSSSDLALSIDDFRQRFLEPGIASMANKIDFNVMKLYRHVANHVGTPGTTPNAILDYLKLGVKLNDSAAPMDGNRCLILSPLMEATIVDALKGLFQASQNISDQYRTGKMGTAIGFEWYMSQNVNTHTIGALGGTPLVNGANQTGTSIATDGWTAAAANRLKRGDVITFASTNKVNPQNRQNVGSLQDLVVTQDFASAADGTGNVQIDPGITVAGAFQTVSGSPADNAVILIFGDASAHASKATPQGLAFHRDFGTLATADLPLPGGVDMAARVSDKQLGLSLRMIRAYDINTDKWPCRLDILWGVAPLRPELAARSSA